MLVHLPWTAAACVFVVATMDTDESDTAEDRRYATRKANPAKKPAPKLNPPSYSATIEMNGGSSRSRQQSLLPAAGAGAYEPLREQEAGDNAGVSVNEKDSFAAFGFPHSPEAGGGRPRNLSWLGGSRPLTRQSAMSFSTAKKATKNTLPEYEKMLRMADAVCGGVRRILQKWGFLRGGIFAKLENGLRLERGFARVEKPTYTTSKQRKIFNLFKGSLEATGERRMSNVDRFNKKNIEGVSKFLDDWYNRFTLRHTIVYAMKQTMWKLGFYCVWTFFCVKMLQMHEETMSLFHGDFALRVLTFLIGLLISLTLKESLDRYKQCLAALIAFRDEVRSFWYFCQLPLLHKPAARLLINVHMVAYVISLFRFLMLKAEVHPLPVVSMVQREFRSCVLFKDEGVYGSLCSNPSYAEIVLMSCMRTLGLMDSEMRLRFRWARTRLLDLLIAQRVKSPRTSVHLLHAVVHLFLLAIPLLIGIGDAVLWACDCHHPLAADHLGGRVGRPVRRRRARLALATVASISRTLHVVKRDAVGPRRHVRGFQRGHHGGEWDEEKAKALFGPETTCRRGADVDSGPYDRGDVRLGMYITEKDLEMLDIIGDAKFFDTDLASVDGKWAVQSSNIEDANHVSGADVQAATQRHHEEVNVEPCGLGGDGNWWGRHSNGHNVTGRRRRRRN